MAELNNSGSGKWSETDASNTSPSPDGWNTGTFFNQVEPIGRSTMGAIKRFWDRINGTVTTTGTAPHYVYATVNTNFPTAYVQGEEYSFKADKDSAGSDDLAINALAAKLLYKATSAGIVAIGEGDIKAGAHIKVQYDASYNSAAGGFAVIGGLISSQGASPVAGNRSNVVITQASATTTTITADEVIVEDALGGNASKISGLNVTLNISTTGANAIDSGSAPTNGFLYIYAIYGAGQTPAVIAQSSVSANGATIYGNGHYPAGYTQSALIGIIPTNSSAQLPAFTAFDRETFYGTPVSVFASQNGNSSFSSVALTTQVPVGAKTCSGYLDGSTSNPTGTSMAVAATSGGLGMQQGSFVVATVFNYRQTCPFRQLLITTAQTLYWRSSDTSASSVNLSISSYTF